MTNKEFLTAVKNAEVNPEVTAYAVAALDKLTARNSNKKTALDKYADLLPKIFEALSHGEMLQTELASAVGETSPKIGAIARQLVANNQIGSKDVVVPKVGARKAYFLLDTDASVEEG